MTSSIPILLVSAALLATVSAEGGRPYVFKLFEPGPGQVEVIKSVSNSQDGKMTVTRGAVKQVGTMSIRRERTRERRILATGSKSQLQFQVLVDQLTTSIDLGGSRDTNTVSGALIGKTVFGFRTEANRWRLFLKGKPANDQEAAQIAELEAMENRNWYPTTPVTVGETWRIDPGFLRHLTERDFGKCPLHPGVFFSLRQLS